MYRQNEHVHQRIILTLIVVWINFYSPMKCTSGRTSNYLDNNKIDQRKNLYKVRKCKLIKKLITTRVTIH